MYSGAGWSAGSSRSERTLCQYWRVHRVLQGDAPPELYAVDAGMDWHDRHISAAVLGRAVREVVRHGSLSEASPRCDLSLHPLPVLHRVGDQILAVDLSPRDWAGLVPRPHLCTQHGPRGSAFSRRGIIVHRCCIGVRWWHRRHCHSVRPPGCREGF
jgi:hypothetical protein